MLYEFKKGHNTVEDTKNICCAKGEGIVDHSPLTRWFKKFCLGFKNLDNKTKSGSPKTMDSKTVLQDIKANPAKSIKLAQHLTVQSGSSPSQPWQKHLKLMNCATCYKNIAKFLTHPNILSGST